MDRPHHRLATAGAGAAAASRTSFGRTCGSTGKGYTPIESRLVLESDAVAAAATLAFDNDTDEATSVHQPPRDPQHQQQRQRQRQRQLHIGATGRTNLVGGKVEGNEDGSENENDTHITIEDAMERVGFGWFQWKILVASGLCFSADGMQVVLLSFLTPILQHEWHLSHAQAAGLTSAIFAGALVGTLILGPLADAWGRRPVFLLAAAIILLGGLATAVAPNYLTVVAAVCFVGTGVGGLTIPFDILAEFLPKEGRGTNLLRIEYAWTLGVLYVVLVSFLLLPKNSNGGNETDDGSWRLVTLLCAGPCALSLLVGYLVVPESSRWLASKGRANEALQLMRTAAIVNGCDNVNDVFPSTVALQTVPEEKHASIADLWLPQWRHITLCLWGGWFTSAFGYYGTMLVTTRVFSKVSDTTDAAPDSFDYNAIFISSLAEFAGTTLVICVVDRVGRVRTQAVSYSLAGVLLFCFCWTANNNDRQFPLSFWSRWTLITLGFGARVFEMAGTCVTWVATAEILSTEIRGTGHSAANAMARLGAFFCPFLVQGSTTPLIQVGLVMLVVHALSVVSFIQLPETAGREMGLGDRLERDEICLGEVEAEFESDNDEALALNLPEPC